MHHRVQVLDFIRGGDGSFIENTMLGFQVPIGVIAPILFRLDLLATLTAYVVILWLQIPHHCNHNFNIGPLSKILIDARSHKWHHIPQYQYSNYGANLCIWDRLLGRLRCVIHSTTNITRARFTRTHSTTNITRALHTDTLNAPTQPRN